MDRAESRALEAYPKEGRNAFHSYFGILEFDGNAAHRVGYINGYRRAEQELELTPGDIRAIRIIIDHLNAAINSPAYDSNEFYKEVLRRFKEYKAK